MATRDRTPMFRQMRALNEHRPSMGVGMDHGINDDPERALIGGAPSESGLDAPEAPQWVKYTDGVASMMELMNKKMSSLQRLHAAHLSRPAITEDADEDHAIQALTAEIAASFSKCKTLVQNVTKTADSGTTNEEQTIKKNITSRYAMQLQQLTVKFRTMQEQYMMKLRAREEKANVFHSLTGDGGAGASGWQDPGFTDQQTQALAQSDQVIYDRSQEIEQLMRSMVELNEVFKDLSLLIVEQGTMLDQIDANLVSVVANVTHAAASIVHADNSHKAYQKKLCILLLIVVVFGMIIVLFVKRSATG